MNELRQAAQLRLASDWRSAPPERVSLYFQRALYALVRVGTAPAGEAKAVEPRVATADGRRQHIIRVA